MNNDQKINIPRNLEQSEEESINNGNSKEILIKDRILDENQIRALQNKNKNKQKERDINVSDFNSNIRIIDKNEIDPVYKMFNSQINYAKFHSNKNNTQYNTNNDDSKEKFNQEKENKNDSQPIKIQEKVNDLNDKKRNRHYIETTEEKLKCRTIIFRVIICIIIIYIGVFLFYPIDTNRVNFTNQLGDQEIFGGINSIAGIIFLLLITPFLLVNLPTIILICFIYTLFVLSIFFFWYMVYKCCQKRDFKNLCREIFNDIKKILANKIDKCMSENEIIERFSRKYDITINTFYKKYIKELDKLRKSDGKIKLFEEYNSKGEKEIIWELIN